MIGKRKRCGHCYSTANRVDCVTCNREMCEDCISYGAAGKVCGLCKDREEEEDDDLDIYGPPGSGKTDEEIEDEEAEFADEEDEDDYWG